MFKKFRKNDIYVNRVKTYPKVEFFLNSGSINTVYYNRTQQISGTVKDGHIYVQNVINEDPLEIIELDGALLIEGEDFIITENGEFILIE